MTPPKSPFSTPLSRSARETEGRIRNLFQGKRKRPALLLMLAVAAVIALCGSLVAFVSRREPTATQAVLDAVDTLFSDETVTMGYYPPGRTSTYVNLTGYREPVREIFARYAWTQEDEADYQAEYAGTQGWTFCLDSYSTPSAHCHIAAVSDGTWISVSSDSPDGTHNTAYYRAEESANDLVQDLVELWDGPDFYHALAVPFSNPSGEQALSEAYADAFRVLYLSSGSITDYELRGLEHMPKADAGDYRPYFTLCYAVKPADPDAPCWQSYGPYSSLSEDGWIEFSGKIILSFSDTWHASRCELQTAAHDSYVTLRADLDGDATWETVTAFSDYWRGGEDSTTVQVTWEDGTTLEYRWEDGGDLTLEAACLTSTERSALIVEQAVPGSNYGAASLHILEFKDGALNETLTLGADGAMTVVCGSFAVTQTDRPLAAVRVPVPVNKWHNPQLCTLQWTGSDWSLEPDGYFTDVFYSFTVTGGRKLSLALRGRWTEDYRLYYDRIQVFDGNTLIQTITPDSFTPDESWPYDGFIISSTSTYKNVITRDVNFDGAEDFGVLCADIRNEPHCWFLWDEEANQFRYAFTLAGWPELDPENRQLTVQTYGWDDGQGHDYDQYDTFQYNEQGELYLADTRRVTPAAP